MNPVNSIVITRKRFIKKNLKKSKKNISMKKHKKTMKGGRRRR